MPVTDVLGQPQDLVEVEADDRRSLLRYECVRHPIVRFLIRPSYESHRAFLEEVSERGLRLRFKHPLEPGTVLAIQLRSSQAGASLILSAQVRHATPQKDSGWVIGCSLSRNLSEDELFGLL
jgi:hypothetical protein